MSSSSRPEALPSPPTSEDSPPEVHEPLVSQPPQDFTTPDSFDAVVSQDLQQGMDFPLFYSGNSDINSTSSSLSPPLFNNNPFSFSPFTADIFGTMNANSGVPLFSQQTMTNSASAFADDRTFEIPLLKVTKAGWKIAQLLGCGDTLFDPFARRTLAPVTDTEIPSWLQPTEAQQKILHHPFIDILPWPSVRTKLVCIFAQPEDVRPPSARDPMALMHMMADMDDTEEGFRIAGDDGLDWQNWEVGQAFFNNWWWTLDRTIIQVSNKLREQRGAARLRLLPPDESREQTI